MTKKEAERYHAMKQRLYGLGISHEDQEALYRIERTLSRWSEMECGDAEGRSIERDEATGIPYLTYERGSGPRGRYQIADRERGALKRLRAIMSRYPALWFYHQGDPRGCALYVGRWADIPECRTVAITDAPERDRLIDQYYTRGVAVCI